MLSFFFRHALAHLGGDRRRTLFALFCIAAGVAAVVALRTFGLMVQDALARDLQQANRGDLAITMPASLEDGDTGAAPRVDRTLFEADPRGITLSRAGVRRLERWAAARGFEAQPARRIQAPFTRVHKVGAGAKTEYVVALFVEPARYPFYGSVTVLSPAGTTFAQALSGPRDIAVTDEVANKLDLALGDQVTVSGADGTFSVAAVVSANSEARLSDPWFAIFPYVYVPYQTGLDAFGLMPTTYYLRVPPGADLTAVEQDLRAAMPGLEVTTVEDLRQTHGQLSDILTRLVTAAGMLSLLIGGIGVANTMTVTVNRRTLEVAVLKTVGVQGGQIVFLFGIEALMLGAAGSLLGALLGLALAYALRGAGEQLARTDLPLAFYPEAVAMGVLMGAVVAVAFSLMPIVSAGRVRPNAVLQPENAPPTRAGRLPALLVILALTALFGVLFGQILGALGIGLAGAGVTALGLGLLLAILWIFLWLLCRLPAWGSASIRLAQRALDEHKGRAAGTLLGLIVGIGLLSVVLLFLQGALRQIATSAEQILGGNVIVAPQSPEQGQSLERRVARLPGVTGWAHDSIYAVEIVAVNGDRDMAALAARAQQAAQGAEVVGAESAIRSFVHEFKIKLREDDTLPYTIAQGRDLAPGDRECILLEQQPFDETLRWFGLQPGDSLTFRFPGGVVRTATIAGITAPYDAGILNDIRALRDADAIAPVGFVPRRATPQLSLYALQVRPEVMDETLAPLANDLGLYFVTTDQLTEFGQRAADAATPLPVFAAGLALFASGVIMANTVALATLERRRQIGVLKAIGLRARDVLGVLLLENGIVGLAGGVIGTALGALGAVASRQAGVADLPYGTAALLVALALVVTVGATLLAAYGAAQEKPLNVLRYE